MKLSWATDVIGTLAPTYGYRTVQRNLRAALDAQGVTWTHDGPWVLHLTPPHLFEPAEGLANALITMWETDAIPPDLVTRMNTADLVLVPCRANRIAFKQAGVRRPIAVIPFGLEAAHHVAIPADADRSAPIRVLWVSQPSIRKGWEILAHAFLLAFPPGDPTPVELVLKTNTNGAPEFIASTGRVHVIATPYTIEAMVALYRTAHVFAFPSRGEGFGLPVLEAMAAGCLVLAPEIGGLEEFFDARVGSTLPWTRRPARYGTIVRVPEVSPCALAHALRNAVTAWPESASIRRRARARALTWTWTRSAEAVLAMLARTPIRLEVPA